jgi:hypothetical protein
MREVFSVLFPVLVGLYLLDCVKYISQYHLLFASNLGMKFDLKKAGFHFVGLSPLSSLVIAHNYPTFFTATGLYFLETRDRYEIDRYNAEDFSFLSYKDIAKIEADGETVRVNGKAFMRTPSHTMARNFVSLVDELKNLNSSKRFIRIKSHLSEAFDLQGAATLKLSHAKLFFYLKILCGFLFINTFVMLPLVLYSNLHAYVNIYVVAMTIGSSYLTILVLSYLGHRRIYRAEKLQRVYMLLSLICLPVSAIHAIGYLTRDWYSHFHYLTTAYALMPSVTFGELARKELFRIDYLASQIKNSDWIEFLDVKRAKLKTLVKKAGLSLEELLSVPEKRDELATSYCPYCLCEYTKDATECYDCGVNLKRF